MITMDATALAAITNRCTDMMQAAAVAYYSPRADEKRHHTETVLDDLKRLTAALGFEIVEREAAE
ncbi:hypothetical protein AU381_00220 [Sinorhizobium glycinis]|uniref:Uncharacterized protein n=1 Tax=Sinorhizobium glycinis TaxID=1472378 RepID=A0A178XYR7_9HYPH|nr:hypothetical protein [Sinorhizobium glycinis]OAP40387.1 hypothetical protein AU381_00220 [Sinorhizobium glycinis]